MILGDYAFFLQNIRQDFSQARNVYLLALEADPDDAINLTNYASLCLITGDLNDAEQHLLIAWRQMAANPDCYTARPLFVRAALAAIRDENSTFFFGQLKNLFELDITPAASRNSSLLRHMQKSVSIEQYALFDAIYTAMNEPDGLERLNETAIWQELPTKSLEERWP